MDIMDIMNHVARNFYENQFYNYYGNLVGLRLAILQDYFDNMLGLVSHFTETKFPTHQNKNICFICFNFECLKF